MQARHLLAIFILLPLLLACERAPEQKRRIRLAGRNPAAQSGEPFTSTIHLEPGSRRSIAILFFENRTGDPGLEWLEKGLTEMFIRSLSQSSSLAVLSAERIFEIMQQARRVSSSAPGDVELAALVSQQADVEAVLTGVVSRRADSLQIQVKLYDPVQGRIVRDESAEGKELDTLFAMVDQLSQRVKVALTASLEEQELSPGIAELSTNSLEAWRFYMSGVDYEGKAMLSEAIAQYEKAAAADPAFVAARYKASILLFSRGDRERGRLYLEKLKLLRGKATTREQYQIDRLESGSRGDLGQVIAVSKQWLEENPDDIDAYFNLGDLYFALQDYDQALSYYQPILKIDPKYKIAYNQIGYCYARKGDLDKAVVVMEQYQLLAPHEPNPWDSMGEIYYNAGEFAQAEKNLRQALKNDPGFSNSWILLANIYLDRGEYARALEAADQLMARCRDAAYRSQGFLLRGFIQWRMGRIGEAIASLEEGLTTRIYAYRTATWIHELHLEKGDTLGARRSLESSYAFIRDSIAVREPSALNSLANLSLWYDVHPEESIRLIEEAFDRIDGTDIGTWGRFYLSLLYLHTGRHSAYKGITPDFADGFIGYLRDVRNLSFPRENWKGLMLFNRYIARYSDAGIEKYDRLIRYCAAEKLTHPEMIFSLYLADLNVQRGDTARSAELLRSAGVPPEGHWLLSAPFDNTRGFITRYPPERSSSYTGRQLLKEGWRHPEDGCSDGYIDLMKHHQKHNWSLGYGLIGLRSPGQREAQLRIGTNDAVRLWLNGEEVWRINMARDAAIDNDIVSVVLRPGLNRVLIKICNDINEWGYYFRVTDARGRGMPDIEFVPADAL